MGMPNTIFLDYFIISVLSNVHMSVDLVIVLCRLLRMNNKLRLSFKFYCFLRLYPYVVGGASCAQSLYLKDLAFVLYLRDLSTDF